MASFSDPSVPLTEEAAIVADASGAPPVINNHALFKRVFALEQRVTNSATDIAGLDENVADLEAVNGVEYVEVVATESPRKFIYIGEDRRVVRIEAKRLAAVNPGAGVADVVVQNGANQTLQSGATSDATALTTEWVELELSATAGRLDLADGIVRVGLNTADAGAAGGPVWFRVTHIAIPA